MSKLKEAVEELGRRLAGTERDAEEVFAVISKLDRELKARRLDQVKSRVMCKLEEAQERRRDLTDVKLSVKYKGEVDLISPSEKSSPIFAIGLTLKEFLQVFDKTAKLVEESDIDPLVLLKETADEKLSGFSRIRKRR